MHSYQYVKFHRRRSMVRASTGPDLGVSRTEERSGTSHEQSVPSPVKNPKILPKRSSSAAARVITVRPCSRTTTLMSMSNSEAGSIDEDVLKSSTSSYSSPFDRSRSSSVVPPSRTNSSQSFVNLPVPPSTTTTKPSGRALKVLPYLTISSIDEASDEQFLCSHSIRFMINLTGDDSLSYRRNRCKCGKDSMFHNGTQQKLTIKIFPKSRPEVIFRQFDQIVAFIAKARTHANSMVLVFNETGENEVESIPILYMMHYFNSERSRAEAQIVKALSSNPRDGRNVCSMTAETRGMLDLWWTEVKRRSTKQLAGDVNQLNFNRVKERAPIRAAWP